MPTSTIRPAATTDASQVTVVGAANAHTALSDANDGTYVQGQVSGTETQKAAWSTGSGIQALPGGADVVTGIVYNVRGQRNAVGQPVLIFCGDYNNNRVNGGPPNDLSVVTFSSASLTDVTKASAVNAFGWIAGVQFAGTDGAVGNVMDIWFDVTWNYTLTSFRSVMIGLVPFLALVGGVTASHLPAIEREIYRTSRTIILPHERTDLLRAVRDHRWPRYFLPR